MKTFLKLKFIIAIVFIMAPIFLFSQKKTWNPIFNSGIAFSQADRNIDFLKGNVGPNIIKLADEDKVSPLNSIFYSIQIQRDLKYEFSINCGAGFTAFYSDWSLPVNNKHFVRKGQIAVTSDLRTVDKYIDLNFSPNLSLGYLWYQYKEFELVTDIICLLNVSLFKLIHQQNSNEYFSNRKVKVDFRSIESYVSIGAHYKRIGFFLDYRLLNSMFKDKSVYGNRAWVSNVNPTKLRLRYVHFI